MLDTILDKHNEKRIALDWSTVAEWSRTEGKHIIVSFGGGTNSSAMLAGMCERGVRPDAITFADTGGEKPNTYQHIEEMQGWLKSVGFPQITILRGAPYWGPKMVSDGSLEKTCLRLGTLPSKAYGHSSCSVKWKVEPQNRFDTRYLKECKLSSRRNIVRLIGFDAGEPSRAIRGNKKLAERMGKGDCVLEAYPLVDWGWDRQDCLQALKRQNLGRPGKSACFFCPSTKKHEILEMQNEYPQLLDRAIALEKKALSGEGEGTMKTTTTKGLGRNFSWKDFIESAEAQNTTLFDSRYCDASCDTCFDGD